MKEKRRNAESTFSTPPQDNSTSFNSDLTLDEVRTAVASLGTNSKATGTDPISYHMIQRFPEPALRMLHTFFQTCWTTGNIPKDWKKATVVAIPKNGKPPQQTSSYRPIALTPHLGKVYERVLKNRLDHHLEKNEILPLCQASFRKGRNCMEHVVRLIEDTKKWSLKGKKQKDSRYLLRHQKGLRFSLARQTPEQNGSPWHHGTDVQLFYPNLPGLQRDHSQSRTLCILIPHPGHGCTTRQRHRTHPLQHHATRHIDHPPTTEQTTDHLPVRRRPRHLVTHL
ncbi:hypothetical protein ACOMHN_020256 [Nucella lapillus]